jgi:membrane protein implicated in regulation of membrane protease activity
MSGSESNLKLESPQERIANYIAGNERIEIIVQIYLRIFPLIISALFSLYSVITASFFFVITPFIFIFTLYILAAMIFSIPVSILMMAVVRIVTVTGIRFKKFDNIRDLNEIRNKITAKGNPSKTFFAKDKSNAHDPSVLKTYYMIEPVYNNDWIGGLKKIVIDLSGTVFVMLFPGGLFDILYGFTINNLGWRNDTSTIILGVVLSCISVVFLVLAIYRERKDIKSNLNSKSDFIRKIINIAEKELSTSKDVTINFDPLEA